MQKKKKKKSSQGKNLTGRLKRARNRVTCGGLEFGLQQK